MGRQYNVEKNNHDDKGSNEAKSNRTILVYAISGVLGVAFALYIHSRLNKPQMSHDPAISFQEVEKTEDDPHAIFIKKHKEATRDQTTTDQPAIERDVAADRQLLDQPNWKEENKPQAKKTPTATITCSESEFMGEIGETVISETTWENVLKAFDRAKQRVRSWAQVNRHQFSKIELEELYASLKHAGLERPPYKDEPDMNWRGIATWRYDTVNLKPKVRVGGGFVHGFEKDRARAEFELTRALVLSWNPCQLQKKGYGEVWDGLLKCMDLSANLACDEQTFSEANWAVATVIAAEVAPPGCAIPAYVTASERKCLAKVNGAHERKTASK